MSRSIFVAIVSAGLFCGVASQVSAQAVERSGNTYHVAVCPGPSAPGQARCYAHVVTDRAGNHLERAAAPNVTPSGYGPADLRSAYAVTATGSASTIVAIVDAYGYTNAESDLAVYRSKYGLAACTTANGCFTKYNQSGVQGNYPRQNTGWAQETALDLDMVSAMCPSCRIILVEADSTSLANLGAAVNTAAAKGAHVISNSYGGGENGSTSYESAYNHAGIAITVSSGDSGYGVQFPASSPHVTAAGGTSLTRTSSGRGWAETVWSGAGSGCSSVYAKPTWQTDPLCTKRMEADVSAVADPNTGVAVYGPSSGKGSAWQVYGGTSVAAPLIGGVYGVNAGSVTYGSNPYANTAALNDVTSGSNGSCGGTYFCTAIAGYDGPTGLGTPKGATAF
ncbi:MAG TPA: S53 family peptidase [Caulobacteraceae bacterium]|jgi:subtilase family serine protease|nr:S53 family peptidase [Caulobacteraceae bacterium]